MAREWPIQELEVPEWAIHVIATVAAAHSGRRTCASPPGSCLSGFALTFGAPPLPPVGLRPSLGLRPFDPLPGFAFRGSRPWSFLARVGLGDVGRGVGYSPLGFGYLGFWGGSLVGEILVSVMLEFRFGSAPAGSEVGAR